MHIKTEHNLTFSGYLNYAPRRKKRKRDKNLSEEGRQEAESKKYLKTETAVVEPPESNKPMELDAGSASIAIAEHPNIDFLLGSDDIHHGSGDQNLDYSLRYDGTLIDSENQNQAGPMGSNNGPNESTDPNLEYSLGSEGTSLSESENKNGDFSISFDGALTESESQHQNISLESEFATLIKSENRNQDFPLEPVVCGSLRSDGTMDEPESQNQTRSLEPEFTKLSESESQYQDFLFKSNVTLNESVETLRQTFENTWPLPIGTEGSLDSGLTESTSKAEVSYSTVDNPNLYQLPSNIVVDTDNQENVTNKNSNGSDSTVKSELVSEPSPRLQEAPNHAEDADTGLDSRYNYTHADGRVFSDVLDNQCRFKAIITLYMI